MKEPWAGDQVAPTGLRRKRKHIKAGSGGAGWTPGGWLAGEAQPMPTASTAGQLSGSRWGGGCPSRARRRPLGVVLCTFSKLSALVWSPGLR